MSFPIDANIPVLTEVILPPEGDAPRPELTEPVESTAPPASTDRTGLAPASAPASLPPTPEPQDPVTWPEFAAAPDEPAGTAIAEEPAGIPPQAEPGLSREQWETLETEVRERVLLQLQSRIDFVLEQRVRDSLADALQIAVSHLADDIRQGLENSLKDVISRAVEQEIARVKTERLL